MQHQRIQDAVTVQQPVEASGQQTLLFHIVPANPPQYPLEWGPSSATLGSSASTKYLLSYTDGMAFNFTDLNLPNLNASFTGIGSVPATPLTPCALVNLRTSYRQHEIMTVVLSMPPV